MGVVAVRYIIRIILLTILIFASQWINKNADDLGHLSDILTSIVGFLLLLTIVNIAAAILIMVYRLRKNIPYKYTDNVINGINNVYYLIVTIGVLLMFIGFWGIDFKSLLTSLSIVAAALAIISKEYVSGIISGIIISFSKEINIDDYVKIGEIKGKILEINLSKITIINDDDDVIYIPNEKVYQSEIINYTKKEIKKVSIDFELAKQNHTTIEELEKNLTESLLKEFSQYIEANSFNIKIVEIYHDYVALKFQYILTEVNRDVERQIRKKTVRLIANLIKEE